MWNVNPLFIQLYSLWWKDRVKKNFGPQISSKNKVGRELTWLQARVHLRSAGVSPLFTICDIHIQAGLPWGFSVLSDTHSWSYTCLCFTHTSILVPTSLKWPHCGRTMWILVLTIKQRETHNRPRVPEWGQSCFLPFSVYQMKHQWHVQTCSCDNWNTVVVNCAESQHHCRVFCPLLTFLGHSRFAAAAGNTFSTSLK